MEHPAVNGSPRHWSIHSAKLAVVTAVITAALAAAQMALSLAILNGMMAPEATPDALMAWLVLPTLLLAAGWAVFTTVVLRAQARRGLADRAQNRVSWEALPGLAVVLTLLAMSLWGLRQPDSRLDYAWNIASGTLASLLVSMQPVLITALLIPVLRQRTGLTIGALIVAAVALAPTLAQQMMLWVLSDEGRPTFWWEFQLPEYAAYALVAVALLQMVRLRLWDALALQWGLYMALSVLRGLWNTDASASAATWLNGAHQLILWALPALAALYCLLMWDRGISPARPFVAFARRVRALAQHFLPI